MLRFLYKMQRYRRATVLIGRRRYVADVADTFLKHMLGLMFRKSLGKGRCMLFVFERTSAHPIWMYGMRFPIDVLWLDYKANIVGIKEVITPCGSFLWCASHYPPKDNRYVVELPAGAVSSEKITLSTRVSIGSAALIS